MNISETIKALPDGKQLRFFDPRYDRQSDLFVESDDLKRLVDVLEKCETAFTGILHDDLLAEIREALGK